MSKDFDHLVNKLQKCVIRDAGKIYSEQVIKQFTHPQNVGRMNDPDGAAAIKGPCGDTVEIYLIIKNDEITESLFFTDGCAATIACGSITTQLVKGKTINEVLKISPADIIEELGELPGENLHCAILTVSTLHKAVADYLLRKNNS